MRSWLITRPTVPLLKALLLGKPEAGFQLELLLQSTTRFSRPTNDMGGEISTGGEFPPLLYIALWGVEIPPPLTELSHGKGGGIHPPFVLSPMGDLSQGKQKDPLEKYAFIQQNFHFLPTRPFHLPGQNQLSTLRHSDI